MSMDIDQINEMMTQIVLEGGRLQKKGLWIKKGYADKLMDVFSTSDGEAGVHDLDAITDDPAEGIAWGRAFNRALIGSLGDALGMQQSDVDKIFRDIMSQQSTGAPTEPKKPWWKIW